MEGYFTVTINGIPKRLPFAGTSITTSTLPPPRTWVKLSVNGRITEAYLIDQSYEEAMHRRSQARR